MAKEIYKNTDANVNPIMYPESVDNRYGSQNLHYQMYRVCMFQNSSFYPGGFLTLVILFDSCFYPTHIFSFPSSY